MYTKIKKNFLRYTKGNNNLRHKAPTPRYYQLKGKNIFNKITQFYSPYLCLLPEYHEIHSFR
jgi:hypothetical protein